ncbi:MAG TPA: hypothetical protein VFC67_13055, partial [Prolixibacteraceae bacterium]|nr:hypothetical protein [Prolixibacteraceae bacterium]
RIDRIPKTRHRWIKIVSLLTSLGFNLKTKLRTKKINSKYGVHRMLTIGTPLLKKCKPKNRLKPKTETIFIKKNLSHITV